MSKDNPPLHLLDVRDTLVAARDALGDEVRGAALYRICHRIDDTIGSIDRAIASGKTECRPAGECAWIEDEDGIWSAGCGMTGWHFPDGSSPQENTMKFCHHCGKPLAPALEYHRD
jgi:hypothetical protein